MRALRSQSRKLPTPPEPAHRRTSKRIAKNNSTKPKRSKTAYKKQAKGATAAATRENDTKSRLLQDQLRETFRPRKLETTVKIEARKKLEAEELQISREELKMNLDNLYRRIGEEKRFEREKKHAERAAAEKAKETRKYMVLVQTGKLRPVQGTSEDVPMTQPTRHIRHEAKEGQRRGKVLFTAMPAKSAPQISRKIPGTRRSPAQKMSARKTVQEAVTEPRPGKEGCFLAPEQIVDSGIGTRLRTGPKRSRSDIEEKQVASKQSKRLKM